MTIEQMILANRPADSRTISFARECFEAIGTRTEYLVARSSLHSGPATFQDKAEAEDYARRTGRAVESREVPVLRRIRWNKGA